MIDNHRRTKGKALDRSSIHGHPEQPGVTASVMDRLMGAPEENVPGVRRPSHHVCYRVEPGEPRHRPAFGFHQIDVRVALLGSAAGDPAAFGIKNWGSDLAARIGRRARPSPLRGCRRTGHESAGAPPGIGLPAVPHGRRTALHHTIDNSMRFYCFCHWIIPV